MAKRNRKNNKAQRRVMIQCATSVNRDAVRRETINGVEHIIVSSFTLPDDIVMNGGFYPAQEIADSFQTLERTLAPIEHPTNSDGDFVSASDPEAIHNFHAGAFNENVRRENGRVHIDKVINVQEALKTDRGKRLLDRIDELETNSDPRPVHTSVGVFLNIEETDEPQTNAAGDEFTWIARNMVFDHDAILLDSVGAAQPSQGVGLAVNAEGEKCDVQQVTFEANTITALTGLPLADSDRVWDSAAADKRVRAEIGAEDEPNAIYGTYHLWFDGDQRENFGAYKLPFVDIVDGERMAIPAALRNAAARLGQTDGPTEDEKTRIRNIIDGYLDQLRTNAHDLSFTEVRDAIHDALEASAFDFHWIDEVFEDIVIFWSEDKLFSVPYRLDTETDRVTIVGIPVEVDRVVTFIPKVNQKGDAMKEVIVNALKKAGIEVEGLSDDELLAQYNTLQANQSTDDDNSNGNDNTALADVVANALKPVNEKLDALEGKMNAGAETELNSLAEMIGNSEMYPGIDTDAAKLLGVETLKGMAANCQQSFGIVPGMPVNSNQQNSVKTEMPE